MCSPGPMAPTLLLVTPLRRAGDGWTPGPLNVVPATVPQRNKFHAEKKHTSRSQGARTAAHQQHRTAKPSAHAGTFHEASHGLSRVPTAPPRRVRDSDVVTPCGLKIHIITNLSPHFLFSLLHNSPPPCGPLFFLSSSRTQDVGELCTASQSFGDKSSEQHGQVRGP